MLAAFETTVTSSIIEIFYPLIKFVKQLITDILKIIFMQNNLHAIIAVSS